MDIHTEENVFVNEKFIYRISMQSYQKVVPSAKCISFWDVAPCGLVEVY